MTFSVNAFILYKNVLVIFLCIRKIQYNSVQFSTIRINFKVENLKNPKIRVNFGDLNTKNAKIRVNFGELNIRDLNFL